MSPTLHNFTLRRRCRNREPAISGARAIGPNERRVGKKDGKLKNENAVKMFAALIAGSIGDDGGRPCLRADNKAPDPAKFQQRIEKRVDRALTGTDVTDAQKAKVAEILEDGLHRHEAALSQKSMQNRKAMQDAMQAPTIEPRAGSRRSAPNRSRCRTLVPSASPRL